MHKIKGNKWNRRICKWIASLLTAALLVNQNCFLVLAEESGESGEIVCLCDTRCSADCVNEACPVCAEGYEKCGVAEAGTGTGTGEDTENPDTGDGEGESTGTGTETTPEEPVPDTGTGEETEDPDEREDTVIDEETGDSDVGEDEGVNTDEDTDAVSDVDAEDEVDTLLEDDETEDVGEEADISPAAVGDSFIVGELKYRITDENNRLAEVTGFADGSSASRDLVIPSKANEYTVIGIGDRAFNNCYAITSITIPSSVTSIGANTFSGCFGITSITIPSSVTSIGNGAFFYCINLENVTILGSVTSIGTATFQECSSLVSITIPSSVTSIGGAAFDGCSSLASITIPDSVTSIDRGAFEDCSSLTSIAIPDGVTLILESTFEGCSSLASITIPDSVTFIGDRAFMNCSSLESIAIPGSVTSIGASAFLHCRSLESVTISSGIKSIGNAAFQGCSSLESITIPGSVTSIGGTVFSECSNLKSITIPNSVTRIQSWLFQGCSSLASITIPDRVTSIDMGAFQCCSSLESITIPYWVNSIGLSAFEGCSSLTNVKVLNDKITIDREAFWKCEKLNSFQIALSENSTGTLPVGNGCFNECPKDRYLTFLTKDGTTVLNDTTTPTLAAAVKAYDKADGSRDGKWYGWKLPDAPYIPDYQVTINVNKDGSEWSGCGKLFALSADNGVTFITDLTDVANGTYTIYDMTGASDSVGYVNTHVTVDVNDDDAKATVNYYSVTFYNGDTIFSGQIVPGNTTASEPVPPPTKKGFTFYRWATSEDGSTEFDFRNPITAKTDIYASWIADAEEFFTITASAGAGGSVTPNGEVKVKPGTDQQFEITPEDGCRIASVLVDGNEVLGSLQVINYSRAVDAGVENNTRYYIFKNVTGTHTLAASFENIPTGGGSEGSGGDNNDNNGSEDSGGGGTNDNSGSDSLGGGSFNDNGGSDSSSGSDAHNNTNSNSGPDSPDGNISATSSHTSVSAETSVISVSNTAPVSKDKEPKTGYASYMEIYATIAMIAGLSYLLLYFADGKNGMTEEEKKEIVAALVKWAKNGSRIKKYAALAVIFLILVYYHSIGKRTTADWKEVYEK